MCQVVAVLHADDVADPPSGRDVACGHVAQVECVARGPVAVVPSSTVSPGFDQLAGTSSVVEHVAKVDDVEHVDAQIAQIVVHRSDQLVGR